MMDASSVPPNTIIVQLIPGADCLEFGEDGIQSVDNYRVLGMNVDHELSLTYDLLPVPLEVGGVYTVAINEAVAHLPSTSRRRVSQMKILSDNELEELRARGVSIVFQQAG